MAAQRRYGAPRVRRGPNAQRLLIRCRDRCKRLFASSVESRGDSYGKALAETVIGRFTTKVIRQCGPWCGFADVEFETQYLTAQHTSVAEPERM